MQRVLAWLVIAATLFMAFPSSSRAQSTGSSCGSSIVESVLAEGVAFLALETALGIAARFTPTPVDDIAVQGGALLLAQSPKVLRVTSALSLKVYKAAKNVPLVSSVIRLVENKVIRDNVIEYESKRFWAKGGSGVYESLTGLIGINQPESLTRLKELLKNVAYRKGYDRCSMYEGAARLAWDQVKSKKGIVRIPFQQGGYLKVFAHQRRVLSDEVQTVLTDGPGIWIPSGGKVKYHILDRDTVAHLDRHLIMIYPNSTVGTVLGWVTETNLTKIVDLWRLFRLPSRSLARTSGHA